jgi:hypothetical protein
MHADDLVTFELSDDERLLLWCGLHEWAGPARCTEELARAMGFESVANLLDESGRLMDAIQRGGALRRLDWCRILVATEIVFVSATFGSGHDWSVTTGIRDEQSLSTLRALQRRMTREVRGLIGNGLGSRPPGFGRI